MGKSWDRSIREDIMPPSTATQHGTSFGRLLRECRKRAGLSQVQLANCLDISKSTVSKWETGVIDPPGDPAFYELLRKVPGFSESDIALLLETAEHVLALFSEIIQREEQNSAPPQTSLALHIKYVDGQRTNGILLKNNDLEYVLGLRPDLAPKVAEGIKAEATQTIKEQSSNQNFFGRVWSNPTKAASEEAQGSSTKSFTDIGIDAIISKLMKPIEAEGGEHQPAKKPDQRQQAPKKDVVYKRKSRSHYDREYLRDNGGNVTRRLVAAVENNNPVLQPLAEQALQSIHLFAEAEAKAQGASLSQVSHEQQIPLSRLSDIVRKKLVPTLYKDSKTVYLANKTAEELGRDNQDAVEMDMQLARLLRERQAKYFPPETNS
jgi:transcriptional regulator with XRE-family HTH domain